MSWKMTAEMGKDITGVINDHGFSKNGWAVFGICQFGVEVEFKVGIVFYFLITQHNDLFALGSFDILFQDIVNDRVNELIHILEEEWIAKSDGHLKLLQEIRIVK